MPSPIYAQRISEVYEGLETTPNGLSAAEAEERAALYGRNALSEPPQPAEWLKFLGHLIHPMASLLWVCGLIALFSGAAPLGFVIWVVILINASFSYWQEYRAEQAITALKELLPTFARVLRSGEEVQIPADELVPGDMLVLAEGDNIPADARVVEEYGLRVNNAALTGEAMPVRKTADASLREGITEVERPNLIFAGTSIFSGTGKAVVYATGMVTQFGRIANLTQAVREEPSLLMQDMQRITRKLTYIAIAVGAVIFFVSAFDVHIPHTQALIMAIGIIVAIVPEGLLPTVTLTLSKAVQRLAGKNVLVKKLAAVETLGTTSIICTDKSGTLTQNQMTVREVWAGGIRYGVSGVGYNPQGTLTPYPLLETKKGEVASRPLSKLAESNLLPQPTSLQGKREKTDPLAFAAFNQAEEDLRSLLMACLLCNNSRLNPPTPTNSQWSCLGDQTEVALRVLALKGGLNQVACARGLPRAHEIPFDARRKRMSTIHWDEGQQIAFVKGAPKEVLELCTRVLIDGQERPLDNALRAQILQANDDYARGALRVLAMARRTLPGRPGSYRAEEVENDLTFLGLAAMMDPPRPEVAQAVAAFRKAGIRMVMITGDYGLTAESTARRIGMLTTAQPHILTGAELDELEDLQLQEMLDQEIIFARMAPEHKLRLVAAYQARGEVVAVIGDGVNDAPALRKADIGIAMGMAGTGVAKEAADVILTSDNFLSVVTAIHEGRAVYENLRKFATYIFASNVPEIVPFLLMALFDLPPALTVSQILAIDLGTDLMPALGLGGELPEANIMEHPPRPRHQPLLDRDLFLRAFAWLGLIETALCYVGFFYIFYANDALNLLQFYPVDWLSFTERIATPEGRLYATATTAFHVGVVMAQIGNALACRTEKGHVHSLGWASNRFLLLGMVVEVVLILATVYIEPLASLFEHQPLPLKVWLGLGLFAPILYVLDWLRREIFRWKEIRRIESGVEPKPVVNL